MPVLIGVLVLVFIVVGGWFAAYNNLLMTAFFAPKYEQVRRDTFEQSQSYNDGMQRDLENIMMQYASANDTEKAALRSVALHRFSVYPTERLTPELRRFYSQLKAGE